MASANEYNRQQRGRELVHGAETIVGHLKDFRRISSRFVYDVDISTRNCCREKKVREKYSKQLSVLLAQYTLNALIVQCH